MLAKPLEVVEKKMFALNCSLGAVRFITNEKKEWNTTRLQVVRANGAVSPEPKPKPARLNCEHRKEGEKIEQRSGEENDKARRTRLVALQLHIRQTPSTITGTLFGSRSRHRHDSTYDLDNGKSKFQQ